MKPLLPLVLLAALMFLQSCKNDDESDGSFFSAYDSRSFSMGFTSWSYGPELQDVEDTYQFLTNNGDIYAEHIDNQIPWSAWINDTALPDAFMSEIAFRKSNKIPGMDMLLSVSILNLSRNDLADDFDGETPEYTFINDPEIIDAYYKHIDYLVSELDPKYLVIAIEANELLIHSPEKWEQYQVLIAQVTTDIASKYPDLRISESMTLHNMITPDVEDVDAYMIELVPHMNQLDFVAISFYPFFKQQKTREEFQASFDFLHSQVTRPIAFVETAHLAEDLVVEGLNLSIPGNETEQDIYLQTLLTNAQEHDYEFVIWWAHRDFDALWETFPDEVKDIGQIWRDTGILSENGENREAYQSWSAAFKK